MLLKRKVVIDVNCKVLITPEDLTEVGEATETRVTFADVDEEEEGETWCSRYKLARIVRKSTVIVLPGRDVELDEAERRRVRRNQVAFLEKQTYMLGTRL